MNSPNEVATLNLSSFADTPLGMLIQGILSDAQTPAFLASRAQELKDALKRRVAPSQHDHYAKAALYLLRESRSMAKRQQDDLQAFVESTLERLSKMENELIAATTFSSKSSHEAIALLGAASSHGQSIVPEDTASPADVRAIINARMERLETHLSSIQGILSTQHRLLDERLNNINSMIGSFTEEATKLRHQFAVVSEESLRDPLTGLYNRLAYDRRIALELTRAQVTQEPLSLVVCDIDNFKRINDTCGHPGGDKVLKEASRIMLTALRGADFVGRYGGEEFVIILPGADSDSALFVSEKLRRTIKVAPFSHRGQRVQVTASFGVTTLRHGDTPEALFERADQALYSAKQAGRDRSVVAQLPDP